MKSLVRIAWIVACLATSGAGGVFAQAPDMVSPDVRAQIARERDAVQKHHDAQIQACGQKFAVNDCIHEARKLRSARLDELRKQELQINERERRHRAQAQLQKIEQRKERSQQRNPVNVQVQQRPASDAPASEKSVDTTMQPRAAATPEAGKPHVKPDPDKEMQDRHEQKLTKARQHREKVLKEKQERKKPPAPGLPLPSQ